MRVRAIERGYDNVALREPGDEFDMPDGAEAHWFEPVEPVNKQPKGKSAPVMPVGSSGSKSGSDLA